MSTVAAAHATSGRDDSEVVLSARDIVKTYGGTRALKGVNFDVHRGKVTTLFGENGAGKSTLMKILSGVEQPTSGAILLDGEPVVLSDTNDARDRGISIIHQELSLAPNLSVRDNMFMGRELTGPRGVDYKEEERRTREVLADLAGDIDPMTPVSDLRLGQQQLIEIARALLANSRILIMDEPTSALSASEVEVLFTVIADLKARGVSIVYISHHLEEALQITDYAVVLRDGSMTANAPGGDIDLEWVVRRMVGEGFDLGSPPTGYPFGEVALAAREIVVADVESPDRRVVAGLSLEVRAGEIVCIYGLMGAGRTELLESLAGRIPMVSGTVEVAGEDFSRLSIQQRIERGLNENGVAVKGGASFGGTIFRVSTDGDFTVLYSFLAQIGSPYSAQGRLVQAGDGNFYGTTNVGGTFNVGTIFKVTPTGGFTTLYNFTNGADGGNLYGTTSGQNGTTAGTVYRLDLDLPLPAPLPLLFTPSTVSEGDTITIKGDDFLGVTGVVFPSATASVAAASFTVLSKTVLQAVVPTGAVSGVITLRAGDLLAATSSALTVNVPVVVTPDPTPDPDPGNPPTGTGLAVRHGCIRAPTQRRSCKGYRQWRMIFRSSESSLRWSQPSTNQVWRRSTTSP